MSHYDDFRERDYAEAIAREAADAKRDIPPIIADLEEAALKLRRATRHVRYATRMESDIQFTIAALKGQLA